MLGFLYPLLKIDSREAEFSRRGFQCSQPAVQAHLERVGRTFLQGYQAALREPDQRQLAAHLNEIEIEYQGFTYEGAAMAMALLDGITPWQQRFSRFAAGAGEHHIYMLHVGAGWACARLPWLRRRIESRIRRFHPVLGWLVIDGYGFHEGYFHWNSALRPKIEALSQEARHVFYQGLGRSLWFVKGADASEIARTIASFAPQYHADAWSGIGIACAYAGGTNRAEMEKLSSGAAPFGAALAQGAAFAAKARLRAGNLTNHTEIVCQLFCGMSAEKAAGLCDETLNQVDIHHSCPYQDWRELLQYRLQAVSEELERENGESRPAVALSPKIFASRIDFPDRNGQGRSRGRLRSHFS
jgi:enediyne biosynthesis protein E3